MRKRQRKKLGKAGDVGRRDGKLRRVRQPRDLAWFAKKFEVFCVDEGYLPLDPS